MTAYYYTRYDIADEINRPVATVTLRIQAADPIAAIAVGAATVATEIAVEHNRASEWFIVGARFAPTLPGAPAIGWKWADDADGQR